MFAQMLRNFPYIIINIFSKTVKLKEVDCDRKTLTHTQLEISKEFFSAEKVHCVRKQQKMFQSCGNICLT